MSPTLTSDTPTLPGLGWLSALPTPQTKTFCGVVVTIGTFLRAWWAPIDHTTLGLLLGACMALFGISYLGYAKKRTTDLDYQAGEVQKIEAAQPTEKEPV